MRWNRQRGASSVNRRARSEGRAAVVALLFACTVAGASASPFQQNDRFDRRSQVRLEDAQRKDGEALLNLADAAMSGRPNSDFAIRWTNDFFKAQTGTFVPFTVTIDRSSLTATDGLMYVRATRREATGTRSREGAVRYPFDVIFPVALTAPAGQPVRITRGFAVAPGDYDVYVALRERSPDPFDSGRRLKGAVIKQPLTVPDFWTGELATSTIMLADGIDEVAVPVTGDAVLERPYVVGTHEIHRTTESTFRRNRELIVVFLIYNAAGPAGKDFNIEVDYHLFRRDAAARAESSSTELSHPPARAGERYVTRTTPQRFTLSAMGNDFDPATGPILAGQGILLSSFQEGEYRLGITVTDLSSRQTLSRDVMFSVAGS
jgi:hypothetical protein